MILYIKNMICQRCQMIVGYELQKIGLEHFTVTVGRVEISEPISPGQLNDFKLGLIHAGLELVDNKKNILIEKIIGVISDMIHHSDYAIRTNFSNYLSKKLNLDYTYMANVFSEIQETTIEQYIINHRIQRVKQLICNKELSLTEISWKLHYSSVAHLSIQFKKVTGITPSHFKHIDCNSTLRPEMCEL